MHPDFLGSTISECLRRDDVGDLALGIEVLSFDEKHQDLI